MIERERTFRRSARLGWACLLAIICGPAPGLAADYLWPFGASPCSGSLQSCVSGVPDGSRVLIREGDSVPDGYYVVNESITFDAKNLVITAAQNVVVDFAPGRSVSVEARPLIPSIPDVFTLTISNVGFLGGGIRIDSESINTTQDRTYQIDNVRMRASSTPGSCAISFLHAGTYAQYPLGVARLRVTNSRIVLPDAADAAAGGICASSNAGEWHLDFANNDVDAQRPSGSAGIYVSYSASGLFSGPLPGRIAISRNRIRTSGQGIAWGLCGICIDGGAAPSFGNPADIVDVRNNVVSGFGTLALPDSSAIRLSLDRGAWTFVNNTLRDNLRAAWIESNAGLDPATTVRFANNIFHENTFLSNDSPAIRAVTSAHHNLRHLSPASADAAIPPDSVGAVSGNPHLLSDEYPAPGLDSPAINTGDNAVVAAADVDRDGEQRIVDAAVDLGAFEFDHDASVRHVSGAANSGPNYSWLGLTLGSVFGTPTSADRVYATPVVTETDVPDPSHDSNLGVFYLDAERGWAAFWENQSTMNPGSAFAVSQTTYSTITHVTTPDSVALGGFYTEIDHPSLNGNPFAVAVVAHNYSGLISLYHDHPVALIYNPARSRWVIENEDFAVMPVGVEFNLQVLRAFSPNAVTVTANESTQRIDIRHALIDGNPCAVIQVSRRLPSMSSPSNTLHYALQYRPAPESIAGGTWSIVSRSLTAVPPATIPFAAGTTFNVIIDGSHANSCATSTALPGAPEIFADGFD